MYDASGATRREFLRLMIEAGATVAVPANALKQIHVVGPKEIVAVHTQKFSLNEQTLYTQIGFALPANGVVHGWHAFDPEQALRNVAQIEATAHQSGGMIAVEIRVFSRRWP